MPVLPLKASLWTGKIDGMTDSKDKKKPGFTIPKLTETQWSMLAGVIFFVGYALFTMMPASAPQMQQPQALKPIAVESEEQRFKRENKNTSLPDGSAVPANFIDEHTQLTQQVPFGDRQVEFRVRLPVSWVMSEFARYGLPGEEDYAVLTNIARYFGPSIEDMRPYMWVEVEKLRRHTTAEIWARAYMIKRGITPEAVQVKSPTDTQALYVDVRDLRSYAVRSLFRIEGNLMIMVSMGVPIHAYKDYKDMMGLVLNSFALLRPIQREIEPVEERKLLNVMKFNHFKSWLPRAEFSDSTLRPSIELHNPKEMNNPKDEVLQGVILVNAWRESVQMRSSNPMKIINDRLTEMRITLADPIKTETLPPFSNFTSVERREYAGQVNTYVQKDQFDIVKSEASKTTQAVYMTILDNGYYKVFVTLISPPRDNNYVIWAQNMEQYEMLIKSLEVRGPPTEADY